MKPIYDPGMKLSEHFELREFLKSRTAEKLHIPNIPLKCHITALQNLVDRALEPIRQHLGLPILVTSGYRCQLLNEKVGGAKTSQHLKGEAADITVLPKHRPFAHATDEQITLLLFNYAKEYADFDQLIIEHEGNSWWIHISCKIDYRQNRQEKLKIENGKVTKIE